MDITKAVSCFSGHVHRVQCRSRWTATTASIQLAWISVTLSIAKCIREICQKMPVLSHELQVQFPSLRRLSARVESSASFRSAVANKSVGVAVRSHLIQIFLCSGRESISCARPCKQKGLKSLVCAFGRFYVKVLNGFYVTPISPEHVSW